MNIQIRLIYFFIITLLISFSSCNIEKRLHFPGYTVSWKQPNKVLEQTKNLNVLSKLDTNWSKATEKKVSTIERTKPKKKVNQQAEAKRNDNEIDKTIRERDFENKNQAFRNNKTKFYTTKILKKNKSVNQIKNESIKDHEMQGFFGSLITLLVCCFLAIIVAILIVWILSQLPTNTALIIGGILIILLLLMFYFILR